MTQSPVEVDFVEWCGPAVQRLLLRKDDIENMVNKAGRLGDFKQDMASWSKLHNGQRGSVPELSQKLYDICARYELLAIVTAQRSSFRGAVRSSGRAQDTLGREHEVAGLLLADLAKTYRDVS